MNPQTSNTLEVVQHFNDAFNRHDVDAVMALMSKTCVFENTRPAGASTSFGCGMDR